ncbi:MAG TPA: MarR family transcriptional regulator [Mycobacteriales bacterium]|nr:MarR family transcriptional regulator [Mycobacteriales bacterium]
MKASTDGAAEGRTRDSVSRLLLRHGPSTAATLGERLGLSPAAVRRHLDAMLAEGLVTYREVSARGRGRGRPARVFALTDTARLHCGEHAYDELASEAIRYLAENGGPRTVTDFAEHRVTGFENRHRDRVARAGGPAGRVEALAMALTDEGYAASAHTLGTGGQLCQHHCPVAHVAAEFPQLCEAETRAFARMLGTHVQRLATIARGDEVCTTHVPAAADTNVTGTTPEPGRKYA